MTEPSETQGECLKRANPTMKVSWVEGGPTLVTLDQAHFRRMQAVIAAARSGNELLIKLSLEHLDFPAPHDR